MNQPFSKPAKSATDLVNLCEKRGLIIADKNAAAQTIRKIGYYRLSAYMLPFQEKGRGVGDTHNFMAGTSFDTIIDLYNFDQDLRFLVFEATTKIEIAARAAISDYMSLTYNDPHWFLNISKFSAPLKYYDFFNNAHRSFEKLGEEHTFTKHYKDKYSNPELPPSWMLFEIISLGQLTRAYKSLKLDDKRAIAKKLALDQRSLGSWLHTITFLRNSAAHHARLWNNTGGVPPHRHNKIKKHFNSRPCFYNHALAIQYLLDQIEGNSDWRDNLRNLFNRYPSVNKQHKQHMGFDSNWEKTELWQ